MANIKIAFINESSVVTDGDARNVMAALQTQVSSHFAPVWGVDATLTFFSAGQPVPAGYWWLTILDDSDQAGDLGYHDLTTEGLPIGKIFAKSDIQYNSAWSVTASHELLEMLADPDVNLAVFSQNADNTGVLYSYEVCDACEDDSLGYQINGVLVSDFVYPSWFEGYAHPAVTQFDYQNHVAAPFQLLAGGYISIYNVTNGNGWTQLNPPGAQLAYKMRAKVGSRRERRRTPRHQWMRSNKKHGSR